MTDLAGSVMSAYSTRCLVRSVTVRRLLPIRSTSPRLRINSRIALAWGGHAGTLVSASMMARTWLPVAPQ